MHLDFGESSQRQAAQLDWPKVGIVRRLDDSDRPFVDGAPVLVQRFVSWPSDVTTSALDSSSRGTSVIGRCVERPSG